MFDFNDYLYKIDKTKITETSVVSCENSSEGIYVDFNYSYDDFRGYGEYENIMHDTDDDEETWSFAQELANYIAEKYKVSLHIND